MQHSLQLLVGHAYGFQEPFPFKYEIINFLKSLLPPEEQASHQRFGERSSALQGGVRNGKERSWKETCETSNLFEIKGNARWLPSLRGLHTVSLAEL